MGYVYSVMWLLVGLILIFKMTKENKIFYLAGAYFLFLGTWWLIDTVSEIAMFEGVQGIILKVVSGIALVLMVVYFAITYRRAEKQHKQSESDEKEKRSEDNKDW